METSNSAENYIKAIYRCSGESSNWVNTSDLAEKMCIKPSSVTDMLKKLSQKKLVTYKKYQGVKLTPEGNKTALEVIRKHRLWEVFLHKKLGFLWDEVHEIAEQLEHISSTELTQRLDVFLDFPEFDPHGDPIPNAKGIIKKSNRRLLSDFKKGEQGKLVGVVDSSASFLQFLESKKIHLGSIILIKKRFEFDGSMEVEIKNQKSNLNVSREVCMNLYLSKNE